MNKFVCVFVMAFVMVGVTAGINYAYAQPLFGWDSLIMAVVMFFAALGIISRYESEAK